MKKKTFIMGLAALALAFGSAGVIGGVSLSANDSAVMTRASSSVAKTYDLTSNVPSDLTSACATEGKSLSKDGGTYARGMGCYGIDFTLTTTVSYTSVSKIEIVASSNGTGGSLETTVGGVAFGEKKTITKSNNTTYTIESTSFASGIVVIKANKAPSKSIWIKTITIYTDVEPGVSVESGSNIAVSVNDSTSVNLITNNLPEGGTVSVGVTDETVATATIANGVMTINGLKTGETNYTISMKDGSLTEVATCTGKITVSVAVTGITLSSDFVNNATLRVGESHKLVPAVEPSDASKDVTWSVSDENAATVSTDGVLTVIKKTGDELVTVTAASVTDTSKTATLSFYVNNEFAISELISQDGTKLPNGLVSKSSVVSTKGVVTAIEGNNVYIQSGNSAIQLYGGYTTIESLSKLKIGDGVKASGIIDLYSGVTELTSPSATVDENVKETITPLELTADGMIAANTSRLVSAYGAKCLATTEISGTSNIQVDFELSNGTSFEVYIKKDLISTVSSSFGNFTENSYYDIKGIYCLYGGKTSQIIIDEGCFYYPAGTEEVKKFIADYITGKDGEPAEGDTCKAKYDAAKAAYDKLSDNAKTLFTTGADYAEAHATYTYWENHQSSANSAKLVNNSNTTDWTSLAVIGGALLLAAGACVYFFYNKKKKQNR